ncbi:hypothetical protein CJ030_MR2G013613 [Morella rubra]|uniref:Pentatricopeptide repeat-containing protein n=1 Tax=Morella rubra TaxID=262757 RepID=A0A6A1WGA2_9ROSI|nr:hypothetical protein CJ030_MR2G013613 [Morella rubra]
MGRSFLGFAAVKAARPTAFFYNVWTRHGVLTGKSTPEWFSLEQVMFACGKYNLVHEFFRKLQKSSIPNALTYKVVVNTLWQEGKTDEAVLVVQDMERRGIVGSAALYYDLARCLCSAGRCQDAVKQGVRIASMAFFRSLVIKAKTFQFSVSFSGLVTLTEHNRKSQNSIRVGRYGVVWLANMFSKLVEIKDSRDFSERFNEPPRAYLDQLCSNQCGRYVALAEFGDRRRRGAVMIPEGSSSAGWQAFALLCEEVILAIGELKRRKKGPGASSVRPGISFANVAQTGLPETKEVGKSESRKASVDVGSMQKIVSVGVPLTPHAHIDAGRVLSDSYNCSGISDLAAGSDGVLWAHLMKLKNDLDGLIGLVKNKTIVAVPSVGPQTNLCCRVCGFKLVAQDSAGVAHNTLSSSSGLSGLGSGPPLGQSVAFGSISLGPDPPAQLVSGQPVAQLLAHDQPEALPSSPGLYVGFWRWRRRRTRLRGRRESSESRRSYRSFPRSLSPILVALRSLVLHRR